MTARVGTLGLEVLYRLTPPPPPADPGVAQPVYIGRRRLITTNQDIRLG